MADRCDICGVAAPEGQHFVVESFPLRRPKRFCPVCHKAVHIRSLIIFAVVPALFALAGIVEAYSLRMRLVDSLLFCLALFYAFQWLMTFPHELGHFVAGRLLGFGKVRILIGSGWPLFSVKVLGVPLDVAIVPLGGLTLPEQGRPERWRNIAFVAAGPLVDLLGACVAWLWALPGDVFGLVGSAARPLFWASILLLLQGLIPQNVNSSLGIVANDGQLLRGLLFDKNKPSPSQPSRLRTLKLVLCHFLKWIIVVVLASATVLFGSLMFLSLPAGATGALGLAIPLVLLVLTAVAGWITWRVAGEPIMDVPEQIFGDSTQGTPQWSQPQKDLLRKVSHCTLRRDFAKAESVADELLSTIADPNSEAYAAAFLMKLDCVLQQRDAQRAEHLCLGVHTLRVSPIQKQKILDGFICQILYKPKPSHLDTAERLARVALELAPDTPTLKGTLGGVLVELGNYREAEPLLAECLARCPAVHDRAISSFYLGVMRLHTGDRKEGKQLVRRAMGLFPQPWMWDKAKALKM